MFEEVQVLTHSSIKISGDKVLYFDPYEISKESHDADIIMITHDHFDHYSPDDIKKIVSDSTYIVLPESMKSFVKDELIGKDNYRFVSPNGTTEIDGIVIKTIPAYNNMKPFHPKDKGYVGYLVTMNDVTYYVAGDTDVTPENKNVKCDVVLVPVGGKYTMDYKEAAELVNAISPKLVVPTHYGTVAGSKDDGKKFANLVNYKINVKVMM